MTSFLEKLNKRGLQSAKNAEANAAAQAGSSAQQGSDSAVQADVDVQQSLVDIIICSRLPGVDAADLRVSVEGENDIIVIQGECKKPDVLVAKGEGSMKAGETAMYIQKECKWGTFYRKVVLPVEIDPSQAEATMAKGVLILRLPLKTAKPKEENRIMLKVTG
jgi:HSP20 family molecular chaperone IbpA